jgi:hypothetical protein
MIGKVRDTAIGLYPVIKTYIPTRTIVITAVVAFLFGMFWAYVVFPVVFYDADPQTLEQGWQNQWVNLVNDRYTLNTTNAEASAEFNDSIVQLLAAVDNPQTIVQNLGLTQLTELAAQAQTIAPPTPPGPPNIIAQIIPFILGALLVAAVAVIWSLLFGFYVNPMVVEPIRKRMRGSQGTDAAGAAKIQDIKAARAIREQLDREATAAPASDLGPPVVRHVSIYQPGRAYDDSFSIEDASKDDEFLGECGATISETIGVGDPEKVTAIEIWLFDKEDFVRTLTSVFVSEHAFNDPAIRSKLEPKGELVLAQPGAIAKLETNTLRLQARIVDMAYGTGPLPPNSYFDKMTIEIQAWRKSGATATVESPVTVTTPAAPPMPDFAPPPAAPAPTYTPPPAAPTYQPPPSNVPLTPSPFVPPTMPSSPAPTYGGGLQQPRPAQPPPQRPPDDDPFGGTGDFTPIG